MNNCLSCGCITSSVCSECKRSYCSKECHLKEECYYVSDLRQLTLDNNELGPIILHNDPSGRIQIGIMSVNPGQSVPKESHKDMTQVINIESGKGGVFLGENYFRKVKKGSVVVVPSGTTHMIKACPTSKTPLKLYTLYAKNTEKEWEH